MASVFQAIPHPVFSSQNQTAAQLNSRAPQKTEVKYKEQLILKIKEIMKAGEYASLRDALARMDQNNRDANGKPAPLKAGTSLNAFAAYIAGFGNNDFRLRVYPIAENKKRKIKGFADTKEKRGKFSDNAYQRSNALFKEINSKLPGLNYSAQVDRPGTASRMYGDLYNQAKNEYKIINYAYVRIHRNTPADAIEFRIASSKKLQAALGIKPPQQLVQQQQQAPQQQQQQAPQQHQAIPYNPPQPPRYEAPQITTDQTRYYNSPADLVTSIARILDRTFKVRYKYGWDFKYVKSLRPGQLLRLDCSSFVGLLLELAEDYFKGSNWKIPRISTDIFRYFDGAMTKANRFDAKFNRLVDGNVYVGYRKKHVGLILADKVMVGKVDEGHILPTLRKVIDLPKNIRVESYTPNRAVLRSGKHGREIVVAMQGGKAYVQLGEKSVSFNIATSESGKQLVYSDLVFLNLPSRKNPRMQFKPLIKYDLEGRRIRKESRKRPLYAADTEATFEGQHIPKDKITPETIIQSIRNQFIRH